MRITLKQPTGNKYFTSKSRSFIYFKNLGISAGHEVSHIDFFSSVKYNSSRIQSIQEVPISSIETFVYYIQLHSNS